MCMCRNSGLSLKTLMEIKKKECVLIEDGVSNYLQIWTVESSLDVRGNKAIKKIFCLLLTVGIPK